MQVFSQAKGYAEATLSFGFVIALGVVAYYIYQAMKGVQTTASGAANAIGTAAAKANDILTNPWNAVQGVNTGNATVTKTITDLGNVDENGVLTAPAGLGVGYAIGNALNIPSISAPGQVIATGVPAGYGGSVPPDMTADILAGASPEP